MLVVTKRDDGPKKKSISEVESVESCVLTLVTIVCRLVVQFRSHGPYARILVHTKETHKHTGSRLRCFIEQKASQRSLK